MADETLATALALWPQARDRGRVDDAAQLDVLLDAIGRPGAYGYEWGLRHTFACFGAGEAAACAVPTGERAAGDEEARLLGHLLVTRVLLATGLGVDERVQGAVAEAHALSWVTAGGAPYHQSALVLATSLWLVALDPDGDSDRPLPIDWTAECFRARDWWDPEERLYSHYDVRERALDWAVYASHAAERRGGVSPLTMAEPLLRLEGDGRARLAVGQLSSAADPGDRPPAVAVLERNRIAQEVRAFLARTGGAGA
jgi:hypothetical protein